MLFMNLLFLCGCVVWWGLGEFFAVRSWDGGEVSFLLQKSDGIELTSLLPCTGVLLFTCGLRRWGILLS